MHGMLQGGLGTQVQVKAFRNTPENNNENNDRNRGDSCTQSLPLRGCETAESGRRCTSPSCPASRLTTHGHQCLGLLGFHALKTFSPRQNAFFDGLGGTFRIA